MNFTDISEIRRDGFRGFIPIARLQATECAGLPDEPGVYLVLWPLNSRPCFLEKSTGGHHKGRNPSVPVAVLESKWVEGAPVIYIGKAGSAAGDAMLRRRLRSYMRFGQGQPVGHWGGRYIWQLSDAGSALVGWKVTTGSTARQLESRLIQDFVARYGKRPFANLRD